MGHDISGYTLSKEKAYLRRNMWSNSIDKLYRALGTEEYNGSVSGTGDCKIFFEEDITRAIMIIEGEKELSAEDKVDYLNFLEELKQEFKDGGVNKVLITFY